VQQGRSVIPKSTKPHRIAENIDVFDFELSTEELAAIDGRRGGPEPEMITVENFGRSIPEAQLRCTSSDLEHQIGAERTYALSASA
jgi:hypothetical protein